MKRLIYILAATFALGLASCSKQDIQPTSGADPIVPSWKSLSNDTNTTDPSAHGSSEEGTSIVDPEVDPEIETSGT